MLLAKLQPCGCQICHCETEKCQNCGAHMCHKEECVFNDNSPHILTLQKGNKDDTRSA